MTRLATIAAAYSPGSPHKLLVEAMAAEFAIFDRRLAEVEKLAKEAAQIAHNAGRLAVAAGDMTARLDRLEFGVAIARELARKVERRSAHV